MNPESGHARRFRDWIARRLGLQFDDSKLGFLTDVMVLRAAARGLTNPSYLDELEYSATESELQILIGDLTVPETYFFRHAEQYRAYADVALPAAQLARGPERRLQVLSVGCASGEEPFSLAMWAQDHGAWQVDVSAVDINAAMLTKAARGLYSAWSLRETPPEVQHRWFHNVGSNFELRPEIRNAVTFQRINLALEHAEFWAPHRYDVIFCRNVLMYFTTAIAQAAVARMTRSLSPHGHLFLGHAETMRGLSGDFHLCHTHNTFYYQRKQPSSEGTRGVAEEHSTSARPYFNETKTQPDLGTLPTQPWQEVIRHSSDRIQALSESSGRAVASRPSAPSDGPLQLGAQLQDALELLKKERFADALALLDGLPPGGERDAEVLLLRAALLTHSGQLRDAEIASTTLLEQDELNAGAHYLLALCRENAGDLKGALDHDEAAIYLDAEFAMPRLHLGLMARRGGDWDAARNALGEAMPLLKREDAARVLLFGGGFGRDGLIALCRAELHAAGDRL